MAIRDENLLKLLLAYSASHRARMLNHPLPSNRIAVWVSEVFPSLRRALEQPPEQISDANVATAIMLASLEIIAPSTFGVGVAWQAHLGVARRMILARGGARAVDWRRDRVAYFLVRWFAYLDVLGSFTSTGLTSPRAGTPDAMFTADLYDFGRENDFQIDCLLGFPGRLAGLLAAIADLARACDARRAQFADPQQWRPDTATVARARQIHDELNSVRAQPYTLCPHRASGAAASSPQTAAANADWEAVEMAATNEAFHAAGLLHLYRRVLGRPREDTEVQRGVRDIVTALRTVRAGGAAEACLLFPLFTAGCEAREQGQRDVVVERVQSMERSGMTQASADPRPYAKVWPCAAGADEQSRSSVRVESSKWSGRRAARGSSSSRARSSSVKSRPPSTSFSSAMKLRIVEECRRGTILQIFSACRSNTAVEHHLTDICPALAVPVSFLSRVLGA